MCNKTAVKKLMHPSMENSEPFSRVTLVVFDFDGVFTDNAVYVSENGTESVRCSRSDGLGLARLKEAGVSTLILSTETNPVVSVRAAKLGVQCVQGVTNKRDKLVEISEHLGIALSEVMFVGNDINDISVLKTVGFPVVVADAWPEVLPYAQYITERLGGQGAVREICDAIVKARKCHEGV